MNTIPFTIEDAKAALQWETGEIITREGIPVEIVSWDNREEMECEEDDELFITARHLNSGLELYYTAKGKLGALGAIEEDDEWDLFIKVNDI